MKTMQAQGLESGFPRRWLTELKTAEPKELGKRLLTCFWFYVDLRSCCGKCPLSLGLYFQNFSGI